MDKMRKINQTRLEDDSTIVADLSDELRREIDTFKKVIRRRKFKIKNGKSKMKRWSTCEVHEPFRVRMNRE